MRWLFLFVLLLNLVYIGWGLTQSPTEPYVDAATLKNVQAIVLLSEVKQSQVASVEEMLVESKADLVGSKSVNNLHAESADGEHATEAKIVELEAAAVSVPPALKSTSAEVVASAKPVTPEKVVVKNVTAIESSADSCFTLGPFRDLDNLRGLTRDIKSYVVATDFRGREEKEQTLYWVYIQPEKNQKKAIATGKRLKAKKIKDFYVIREGEKINGLSLGHFRNKAGAYGVLKKVKNLGFDVVVEPIFRSYTIYWLDYQLASGANIPESIFEKHIKPGKKDKISRLSRKCGV